MDIITSVTTEIALWEVFATSRGANATVFLATVIAVWIAARFSSVMMDKGANTVAKLIGTAFAISVFMLGMNLGGWVEGTYEGNASALAALDAANGALDIGPGSQAFIDNMSMGGNKLGSIGEWTFYISGLLIAVLPLWLNTND